MISDTIQFEEHPDRLRISWDNRRIRKDRVAFWFFLLFWSAWAPATLVATVMIFTSDASVFFLAWCVFGWLGTLGIPALLVQRIWTEWIEIDAKAISWGARGPLARGPKTVPMVNIGEFALGRYSDRDDHESMVTLNIYEAPTAIGHIRRHILAYWLSKELKELIFARIRLFSAQRSIPWKTAIYGAESGTDSVSQL